MVGERKMRYHGIFRRISVVITLIVFGIPAFLFTGCERMPGEDADTVKIGVTLYDQYDEYLAQMMECFRSCFGNEAVLEVYNAAQSQQSQDDQVQRMIENGCDVICVNLVDRTSPTNIIDMAKKNDIPIIFFNRELVEEDLLQWTSLYYVGADAFESGIMEGELAAADFTETEDADRNRDGVMQYVVLEGEAGHQDAIVRTEYSVNAILDQGVEVEKLGYAIANWNKSQAQTKMTQMIDQYGTAIEVVLANNDAMALGAIEAYKQSEVPRAEWPLIYGIDGTEGGLSAIEDGSLQGTVYNDKEGQSQAMYRLALALAHGEDVSGMGLIDGKYIRLPYAKISMENIGDYIGEEE